MPVEILGLHHYTLRTQDLKRASAFYEGVFGLKRKPQPGMASRTVRYDIGGQELQLMEVDDLPERADAPDPRESHPAIEVDNIHNAVAACLSGGAQMQQVTFLRDEDGSHSAFLRDPDGNLLELCSHGGRFSRRAPLAPGLEIVRPAPAAAPAAIPQEEMIYNAEDFFSNRNQKRENWRLILTLLAAALLLGAGVALRYTIFAPRFSETASDSQSVAPPVPTPVSATAAPTAAKAAPTATPAPAPTPETEGVTPSLSETSGVPAPPDPSNKPSKP